MVSIYLSHAPFRVFCMSSYWFSAFAQRWLYLWNPNSPRPGRSFRCLYDSGANIPLIYNADMDLIGGTRSGKKDVALARGATEAWHLCLLSIAACDANGFPIRDPQVFRHAVRVFVAPGSASKNNLRLESTFTASNFYLAQAPNVAWAYSTNKTGIYNFLKHN